MGVKWEHQQYIKILRSILLIFSDRDLILYFSRLSIHSLPSAISQGRKSRQSQGVLYRGPKGKKKGVLSFPSSVWVSCCCCCCCLLLIHHSSHPKHDVNCNTAEILVTHHEFPISTTPISPFRVVEWNSLPYLGVSSPTIINNNTKSRLPSSYLQNTRNIKSLVQRNYKEITQIRLTDTRKGQRQS